jgi:adenine-specific DNA-methyltransferase
MNKENKMEKIDAMDAEAKSADLIAGNIAQLKALFPELITEGAGGAAVNVDVLKALIGDATVSDTDEKYGLNWHGKRRARQLALTPSTGTLRPCQEDSVDWDTTQNLMIEGDNLEVLKLLQKSYAGKVKLIYIDPPYNTGKDFVYPDNFQDSIKNYLELTGQVDGGRKISSNTEASGRFHTDWLNMMYPRLKLARNLLSDDGVIFISIDDSESDRLKTICNEIFGEENHLVTLFIQVRYADKTLAEKNDYQKLIEQIHVYQKREFSPNKESEDYTIEKFCWHIAERKPGRKIVLGNRKVEVFAEGEYEISRVDPHIDGLKETWATGTVLKANASGKYFGDYIAPRKDVDGLGTLYKVDGIGEDGLGFRYFTGPKRADATKGKFFSGVPLTRREELAAGESKKYKPVLNWQDYSDAFGNCRHEGGIDFGAGKKPVALLKKIISMATEGTKNHIILDFFAGSGTTGHATLELNVEDAGNRRFVLIQIPEQTDRVDFPTISSMTKQRLRNVTKKIKSEDSLFALDNGFRMLRLDHSNIRSWQSSDNLERDMLDSIEHILPDRSEQDVLTELLLKRGLDLCVPIEHRQIAGKAVHSIGGGVLMACLGTHITAKDAEPLALGIVEWHTSQAPAGETTCVFRDSAFAGDDVAKTNLAAILEQHGIHHVRSL